MSELIIFMFLIAVVINVLLLTLYLIVYGIVGLIKIIYERMSHDRLEQLQSNQ